MQAREKVTECPICLDDLGEGRATAPCGHQFCTGCLEDSVRRLGMTCPMCRAPIREYTHPGGRVMVVQGRAPAVAPTVLVAPARRRTWRWYHAMAYTVCAMWILWASVNASVNRASPGGTPCHLADAVCYFSSPPPSNVAALCDVNGAVPSRPPDPAESAPPRAAFPALPRE